MKISVLIPSEEYRNYAGARIRYNRLQPALAALGVELMLEDISEFAPDKAASDALIISKCHDSRSLVAAALFAERGLLVGVDLFDDYFSQEADSRLVRFRRWLSQLLPICDFALCSTAAMASVIGMYREDLPVHVINDPAADLGLGSLSFLLEAKLAAVLDDRSLPLLWFGVGDNPNFKIGLADLAAYGEMLGQLQQADLDVELVVLTNPRSLAADGLASLGTLPVRTRVEEWSEDRERELLKASFACFLPVNAQAFSIAKSLNRAVTSLSAGCQIISAGFPLYRSFDELIYRDGQEFIRDLKQKRMRLSPARLPLYQQIMEDFASTDAEAASAARFFNGLERRQPAVGLPIALIHGQMTNGAAHKTVQATGGLSVASPYCNAPLGFDVRFEGTPSNLRMFVADKIASRLDPAVRKRLRPGDENRGRKFWLMPGNGDANGGTIDPKETTVSYQLATYKKTIGMIEERIEGAFGPCRTIVSEMSYLPFDERG